jgi:hypothetical protein
LSIEQVRQIEITPKYKNNTKINIDSIIIFQISAVGYRQIEKKFTIDSFKNIDIQQMLSEVGIPSNKKTIFTLMFIQNERSVGIFELNIKH